MPGDGVDASVELKDETAQLRTTNGKDLSWSWYAGLFAGDVEAAKRSVFITMWRTDRSGNRVADCESFAYAKASERFERSGDCKETLDQDRFLVVAKYPSMDGKHETIVLQKEEKKPSIVQRLRAWWDNAK